ncbi:MAG: histidine phosphatase family protein [Ilumatobacteraceae bacterium]|jgi:probable phosphoglycerate mutase|nr:histidine phosphatase family protein [Ilumatobacteraceae bacterium]
MSDTRVVLVRHGESFANAERFLGGLRTCRGLTDHGRAQARVLGERLARTRELSVDAVVSSSYPRALQTAEIILPYVGHSVLDVRAAFGEHDPGPECDGLKFDEFVARYGPPNFNADPHAVTFPGGETIAEFHTRIIEAFRELERDYRNQTVVVSCHGGTIEGLLRHALQTPSTGRFELYAKNSSITELVRARENVWRLVRYNDHAHLADLPDLE